MPSSIFTNHIWYVRMSTNKLSVLVAKMVLVAIAHTVAVGRPDIRTRGNHHSYVGSKKMLDETPHYTGIEQRQMDRNEHIGAMLRVAREAHGWTLTEAAAKAGISQCYASQIEASPTVGARAEGARQYARVLGYLIETESKVTRITEVVQ